MIILIYTGIILLCYGIYNIFSYYSVLPTVSASRSMKKQTRLCDNALIVELSRIFVGKWDLEWKGNDVLSKILLHNKIYYSMTVYCVSLILTALYGLFLCLPLVLWNNGWFIAILSGVLLYVSSDLSLLVYRYRKNTMTMEKDDPHSKKSSWLMKKLIRFLQGVFFLCQIFLIFVLLT